MGLIPIPFDVLSITLRVRPFDEDIPIIDATAATTPLPLQGPMTRARARQLNQQVLSFLRVVPNVHENRILPK